MLYLGTSPSEQLVRDMLDARTIGLMCQPGSNRTRPGWLWAADNGCGPGADGTPPEFTEAKAQRWIDWLWRRPSRSGCLFAAVPDVVGDAAETLVRFRLFRGVVAEAGYPVAFVAQDGLEIDRVPWEQTDCLFIGGSTAFKGSELAYAAAAEARQRGKWVHVGRVNSGGRYAAWADHADSADGTFLRYAPTENTGRLKKWLSGHEANRTLWHAQQPELL